MKSAARSFWLRILVYVVTFVGLVLVAFAIGALALVEDWRRDLFVNHAATSADAPQPQLRPIVANRSSGELARLVEQVAAGLPRWRLRRIAADGEAIRMELVHVTRLMRFRDDVIVTIKPSAGGSLLEATSRSRIGKGDLGQNVRNLRELLGAIRAALPATPDPSDSH